MSTFYEFEDLETGKACEIAFSMENPPKIGEEIDFQGRKYRRLISMQQFNAKTGAIFWNWQVDRKSDAGGADFYNAKGVPGFKSRESAREWAKKRTARGLVTDFEG